MAFFSEFLFAPPVTLKTYLPSPNIVAFSEMCGAISNLRASSLWDFVPPRAPTDLFCSEAEKNTPPPPPPPPRGGGGGGGTPPPPSPPPTQQRLSLFFFLSPPPLSPKKQ